MTVRNLHGNLKERKMDKNYCECSFVFIMRNEKTDVPYCGECKKEVDERP